MSTETVADLFWSELVSADASPRATIAPAAAGTTLAPALRAHTVGETGGDYQTATVLGRGGMGVVVEALQASLDRPVALKRMHPEAARDGRLRQRFLAEAAVTGALEHPHIVPVHDLGAAEDGTPFYTMKRIHGVAWSEVIGGPSLTEGLAVLDKVCDAVAFAHSRGVLHRDLKPHNVMLGDFGEVLVVDWGLAVRLVDGACPPGTPLGGTPAYMAPEMATARHAALGPRSDVYLLGAILYELLAGAPPHPGDTAAACLEAAAANQVVPPDGDPELARVAMQALATDPADRPASVGALQEQLRAWQGHARSLTLCREAAATLAAATSYVGWSRALAGFEEAAHLWPDNPEAAPGALRARLAWATASLGREDLDLAASLLTGDGPEIRQLQARVDRARAARDGRRRRIRALTGATAALAGALLVGGLVSWVGISRGRDRAVAAEQAAAAQRDLALETMDRLVFAVDEDLSRRPALAGLRAQLLDEAIDGLDRVLANPDAAVDVRLADAHERSARILHAAHRRDEALSHQRQALAILEEVDGSAAARAEAHILLGDILDAHQTGDPEAAAAEYRRALDLLAPLGPEVRATRAVAAMSLGDVAASPDEARATYRLALTELQGLDDPSRAFDLHNRLGDVALREGDLADAVEHQAAALDGARAMIAANPGDREARRREALALYSLAEIAQEAGDLSDAAARLERVATLQQGLVQADSTDGQLRRDLLATRWFQGDVARDAGDRAEAARRYREARDIGEDLLALNPANAQARRDLFVCSNRLGDAALASGLPDEASAHYRRGLELSSGLRAEGAGGVTAWTDEAVSHYKLGEVAEARAPDEARAHYQRALDLLREAQDRGLLDPQGPYGPWLVEVERKLVNIPQP